MGDRAEALAERIEQGALALADFAEDLSDAEWQAVERVREFTDQELDSAVTLSLNGDAPLTAQFMIEDHALRHSFHHLARIRAALGR